MMETERILLRPWLDSDAETLFKYASDPEVGPRAGWPPHKSVEESLEIIRTVFCSEGMWAVIWKESGQPIGCVGYLPASASNLKIAEDQAEVGYWIARPFWGKGICTEALQMVIDYCFNEKDFTMLWGDYFPSNPASGRVMEKCVFVDTGEETRCPNLEVGSDRENNEIGKAIMNILILSGSPRKGGNTELLVEAFAKGAAEHHQVEIVSVRDYAVNPCLGCNACFISKNNICAQKDDMLVIYEKMSQADMLVIASPVYFYGISAQLKAVIDRFHNPIRDLFHIKKMALLLVGAASLPELFDAILTEYNLCTNFFNLKDAGKVLVRGVKDKGDIKNTDALNEAYTFGRSI